MDAWVKLSVKSEAKRTSLLIGRKEGAIAVKATILVAKVNIATLNRESGRRESLGE